MQLLKCLDTVVTGNSFVECYSSYGALRIDGKTAGTVDGTSAGKNLVMSNNNFTNAYDAIKVVGAPISNCLFTANRIDTANVGISCDTPGSSGVAIESNLITGTGKAHAGFN
jgi:hypothetical protein